MAQVDVAGLPPTQEDLELQEVVSEAVANDEVVRTADVPIIVSVANRVVTLSGIVLSRMMRERVLYLAASTPGVEKVVDDLVTDPEIEMTIAQLIANDPALKHRKIEVTSYMGQVTLYAPSVTAEERERALALAATARGVQAVLDHLTVGVPD